MQLARPRRKPYWSPARVPDKDPDEVSDAILHALFDDNPRHRYMVVPSREEAGWTIGYAMQRLVQQNEAQEHSFSRDELIGILDNALNPPAPDQ
jgi:hypothetical protein